MPVSQCPVRGIGYRASTAVTYPANVTEPCRFLINGFPQNPGWPGTGGYAWWTLQVRVAGEYQSLALMAETMSYGPDGAASKASSVLERISAAYIVDEEENLIAQFCWHNPDGRDGGGELRVWQPSARMKARQERLARQRQRTIAEEEPPIW